MNDEEFKKALLVLLALATGAFMSIGIAATIVAYAYAT